jgi:hypothetical protein
MNRRAPLLALALLLLGGHGAGDAAKPAGPKEFAIRLPVTPAPGEKLQRIVLPASLLAAIARADRGDVRLFDRSGRALPLAVVTSPAAVGERREARLPAFPIMGTPGALRISGVTLDLDDLDRARVVRVEGAVDGEGRDVVPLGAFIDSRAIADPVEGIRLDAELPARQPIRFTVSIGDDLQHWRPLAERTIYREAGRAEALGSETIVLDRADLHGAYLRITWSAGSKLLGPVEIRAATLIARHGDGHDGRPAIATSPPTLTDDHHVGFALSHPIAIAALAIDPARDDLIVPVRVQARDNDEAPWIEIGAGTVRRGPGNRPIALSGGAFRQYRIAADPRSDGFSAAPALRLTLTPLDLVAQFGDSGPFTLAAGAAEAGNRYLDIGDLMPGWRAGAEQALPLASVAEPAAPLLVLAASKAAGIPLRTYALWGLLVGGTLLLAAMVYVLWRKSDPAEEE